jgi:hypothetical protein
MKTYIGLFLAMLASTPALASSALVTNPYLPYPPGCAKMPDMAEPGGLESQAANFYESEIQFYTSQTGEAVPMTLRGFRAPCSEENRSLIWLEFTLSAHHASQYLKIQLPTVVAETAPNWRKLMSLAVEPNGWGSGGWVDREAAFLSSQLQGLVWYYGSPAGERRWVFLLDNAPPYPDEVPEFGLTPAEYNAAFKLVLRYNPYDFLKIDVPATRDILPLETPDLPLSGRLSGNWIVPSAADQGILISISESVLPDVPGIANTADMPMVIFLAHYTFDEHGHMLWLTGAAGFGPGLTQVKIPIERVTNGEFRGSRRADRETVGSVRITSRSCNDLIFEFDYSGIGLGAGQRRLERLYSMEAAGHDCRDYEAKVAANR